MDLEAETGMYNYADKGVPVKARITPEQIWYIVNVYPEKVTSEEVREHYERQIAEKCIDRSYWESVAQVVNSILEEPKIAKKSTKPWDYAIQRLG